jgi:hypothetical protein
VVPEPSKVLLRTSLIEIIDLSRRKLKSHRPQVIAQPLFLAASRDSHDILIDTISQADLSRANRVLFAQTSEDVIQRTGSGFCGWGQGAISLGRNALFLVVVE